MYYIQQQVWQVYSRTAKRSRRDGGARRVGAINHNPAYWSCYRKRQYPTRENALATIAQIKRESGRTLDTLTAYKCRHCTGYHIGNT